MNLLLLLLSPATQAACDLTRGKWVRDDDYYHKAIQHYKQCSPKRHKTAEPAGGFAVNWRVRPMQTASLEVRWFQHFTSTVSFVGDI